MRLESLTRRPMMGDWCRADGKGRSPWRMYAKRGISVQEISG